MATSVTFINELARLCEAVGADARDVERGLRSETCIGPRRATSARRRLCWRHPGPRHPLSLLGLSEQHLDADPLFRGVWESKRGLRQGLGRRVDLMRLLAWSPIRVVAVLGLTYKPGTDTLARSGAVELSCWLHDQALKVRAYDPAVRQLPEYLADKMTLCDSAAEALAGTDVAVVQRMARLQEVGGRSVRGRHEAAAGDRPDPFPGAGRADVLASATATGSRPHTAAQLAYRQAG